MYVQSCAARACGGIVKAIRVFANKLLQFPRIFLVILSIDTFLRNVKFTVDKKGVIFELAQNTEAKEQQK